MSDTPETDAALQSDDFLRAGISAIMDHARRMERERDEAMRCIAMLLDREAISESISIDFLASMAAEKKIREGAKR